MPQLLQSAELEKRLSGWSSSVRRYPFFEGPISNSGVIGSGTLNNSVEDLRRWFNDIELAANDCHVPLAQYPDVAIHFLRGDLKEVMRKRRDSYLKEVKKKKREAHLKETETSWWDWLDFKEDMKRIVEGATKIIASIPRVDLATIANPYITSSLKLGLVIGGTVVLLPAVMAWRNLNAGTPVLNTPN